MFWAILAMLVVILAYDQLLFRPLVAWSAKFRFELTASMTAPDPWVLALLRRTRVLRVGGDAIGRGFDAITGLRLALPTWTPRPHAGAPPGWATRSSPSWCSSSCSGRAGRSRPSSRTPDLVRPCRDALRSGDHPAARGGADGVGDGGLGADRRLARHAPGLGAPGAAAGAVPGRLSRQPVLPRLRRRHRHLPRQRGHLADAADDPGHAVVHPVQRHRRRRRLPRATCRRRPTTSASAAGCGGAG